MSEAHYDASYFGWQRMVGEAGAVLNQRKFRPWIKGSDTVLDFGCGSGALLAALPGTRKIGVEIGEPARQSAQSLGLEMYDSLTSIEDASVDVVISNHALEHVERPLDILREIRRVLKPGGRAVLVVPVNDWRRERRPNPSDRNHHLYTWTPLLFANMLADAGFAIDSCKVLTHAWHPKFLVLHERLPRVYDVAAWALAVARGARQIHAVAH